MIESLSSKDYSGKLLHPRVDNEDYSMKKPVKVAIVGFPNVGKSTLFNRLSKKKKSLVHSLPGMTRDQVSALCQIEEKRFFLLDTGGFFGSIEDPFSTQVKEKAWEASKEADILLYVLDGKRGLLPGEEDLYFSLKKFNKPIIVVVNKVDSVTEEEKMGDFFRLGEEKLFLVSAEHKRNLEDLEEFLLRLLPTSREEKTETEPLKIAVVGRINVGKSLLVNHLSGEERLIVSEIPGTTRDSTDTLIRRNKKTYCLIDTAGIRKMSRTRDKREKAGIVKAKKDIKQADVVCLILDASELPTRQDTAIAHQAHESGKPLVIALNKWDLIEKKRQSFDEFRRKIFGKLDFVSYAPLVSISALTGQRVIKILDLAQEVYANATKKIPTSRLNSFLTWVNVNHPPVSKKGQRIKVKYMVQKGILPPAFILFSRSPSSLNPSYEKFFIRILREQFGFQGTPIRLILNKGVRQS
jgi:GTP-binding protein